MDSLEYIEMTGCERILHRVSATSVNTPWAADADKNLEIVKQFLAHRYQELKDKT